VRQRLKAVYQEKKETTIEATAKIAKQGFTPNVPQPKLKLEVKKECRAAGP
jgi:hypothetical protein